MFSLRAQAIRRTSVAARSFSLTSRVRSGGSHVSNNDPEVLEREKQRNLSGKQGETSTPHKAHAPGWNESLASVSEAAIKADQATSISPEELQKVTVEYVTKRHKGEGPTEIIEKTTTSKVSKEAGEVKETSSYMERDEVRGPLGGAGKR